MGKGYLIVDSHVHTYPSAEIGRLALGTQGYGVSGTVGELQEAMKKAPISWAVMANHTPLQAMKKAYLAKIQPNKDASRREKEIKDIEQELIARQERRNRWTCARVKEHNNLAGLLGLDPLQSPEGMAAEVENLATVMGAKGVKLHPLVSEFYPGDERMWPVYARAQALQIPVLFHSGVSEIPGYDDRYARPAQFEKVARAFPALPVILGHFGRGYFEEALALASRCPNILFDTAGCLNRNEPSAPKPAAEVCRLIRKVGASRVLFGSDWPWFDPLPDIQAIENMDLAEEEKALVLGLNARKIYNL